MRRSASSRPSSSVAAADEADLDRLLSHRQHCERTGDPQARFVLVDVLVVAKKAILLVDDDPVGLAALRATAPVLEYETLTAASTAEACRALARHVFAACVISAHLGAQDEGAQPALDVVTLAAHRLPATPCVLVARKASLEEAVAGLRAGAVDFVMQPVTPKALEAVLARILPGEDAGWCLGRERVAGPAAVIGHHPAMRTLLHRVGSVADTDASVLLRGETGTGKEVIARLIHAMSGRARGPFVAINMAAIPESLAEAELFGHEKGAYTGAERARAGKFVAAEGGTLFFDEVGELPLSLQAKLLRVLQDREITPVGGNHGRAIDVRLIAATHRNLEEMVAEGTFREDLFYRLEVVPLEIPPLRERREDIPVLADHFRLVVNAREGRTVPPFSPAVIERFTAHDWRGNVRELEHLVERLVVVVGDREVSISDLPPYMRLGLVDLEQGLPQLPPQGVDLRLFLTQLEDRFITQALERASGNKNRAAELLGINRTTLVEKLRRRHVA